MKPPPPEPSPAVKALDALAPYRRQVECPICDKGPEVFDAVERARARKVRRQEIAGSLGVTTTQLANHIERHARPS